MIQYMLVAGVIWLVPGLSHWKKRKICSRILQHYCRLGLWILGVRVNAHCEQDLSSDVAYLMVGNHLSYLDILIIASLRPTSFVTSNEIKEVPFLGHACRLAGCLFVERRNKVNLMEEIKELTEGLRQGLNVVVFPEATSTNGEQILRFRRPLFASAGGSGAPILPFCLNYRALDEEVVTINNRDHICWYGDMAFAPHLWTLGSYTRIDVDLHFLPSFSASPEAEPGELAAYAQAQVESVFRPFQPSENGLSSNAGEFQLQNIPLSRS